MEIESFNEEIGGSKIILPRYPQKIVAIPPPKNLYSIHLKNCFTAPSPIFLPLSTPTFILGLGASTIRERLPIVLSKNPLPQNKIEKNLFRRG